MEKWLSKVNWGELMVQSWMFFLKLCIILAIFFIVKTIGKTVIARMFDQAARNKRMTTNRVITLQKLVLNLFSYLLIFIFAGIIFDLFGLDIKTLIAGAGILGLAIGFGAQGLVSDIVTGFFVLLEKQMDVGDFVTMGNVSGIVEEVGLRTTHIRAFDGTLFYVPNREISTVANHSRGNMQALVDIGIAYEENIDEALEVIRSACENVKDVNDKIIEGPNVLGVQSFGSSEVVIRILAKTVNMEQWGVERALRKAIKEALDEADIEIPYPHQVHIDKKVKVAN
ncbi:mechanosensitive ion channel family protein [Fictibacillus aquaticus]